MIPFDAEKFFNDIFRLVDMVYNKLNSFMYAPQSFYADNFISQYCEKLNKTKKLPFPVVNF